MLKIDQIIATAISLRSVRPDGTLTDPRSYGVYQIPTSAGSTRRFRFGNHRFGNVSSKPNSDPAGLVHLFLDRDSAEFVAKALSN